MEMDFLTEDRLVCRLQSGEREAFSEFLAFYTDKVYNLSLRMVGVSDAEDVAQDALVQLCNSIGSFKRKSKLSTWVYRVAVNVCLEHRRKRKPETVDISDALENTLSDNSNNPYEKAVSNENKASINKAIDSLSEIQRDVVILHEIYGLTYSECAKALECPVGTIKSRLSNAFTKLKSKLGEIAPDMGGVL